MLHRPSYFSLHRIAAAMSARTPFRGGRGRRSFSDHHTVVSGDFHFQSNSSLQNRHGNSSSNNNNNNNNNGNSTYSSNNNDYRRVYFSYDNLNSSSSRSYNSNSSNNGGSSFQPQLQSYRPRAPFHGCPNQPQARPRPADFRNWEFAKHPPPPHSERFVVLSYNILADYLANNHRTLYWHIPRRFMSWDWRKRSIIFELGLWSADIMCFQEVDKFHELEEDLKPRGYSGIWKMRTGEPIDGCAIFWRTSKFKLVYDECVEFNKLGMRDNVAQVCVLESLVQNQTDKKSVLSEKSEGPKRVVVCNIHVLYNPRRGEIKLGQVRVLLERAQAVSKKWDDTPVVLCGDFNCVPKSPLYDFISQQKLDISGIDRDKVSGQASAEIRQPPRQFGRQARGQSIDNMANPATNQNNSFGGKQNDSHNVVEFINSVDSAASVSTGNSNGGDSSDSNIASKTNQDPELTSFANSTDKDVSCGSVSEESVLKPCPTSEDTSKNCSDDTLFPSTDNFKDIEEEQSRDSCDPSSSLSSNFCNVSCSESLELDPSGLPSTANPAPTSIDEPNKTNASLTFKNLDEKLAELSLRENEELGEDVEKMSGRNDEGDAFPSNLGNTMAEPSLGENEELGEDAEKMSRLNDEGDAFSSNLGDLVLEDLSFISESEVVDADKPAYDPSRWTPMEIATATGNYNNTVLEHSLKVMSTYTEVEDRSGTRDAVGEPLVTSYNSCFMGTVDYIWRSEGLCTVKALAPIPKNTMQPSGGFPAKKWGSDHIALATELAFTK